MVSPSIRTAIIGPPRSGKTTMALADGRPVYHTDDTIEKGWSEASAEVATWFDRPGPWIVEGVAVARALRKWLTANTEGMPCEEMLITSEVYEALSSGQAAMAKGIVTVLNEVIGPLTDRGVSVIYVVDGKRNQ